MDDTSPEIKKQFQKMLMKRSGVERIIMGADMAESAKVMVLSSMDREKSEAEKRVYLFLKFYYNDFSEKDRNKIVSYLKNK